MNLLNSIHNPDLPTWKFVAGQALIGLTTLAVISVAIAAFSIQASFAFAVPFAITGAIGIYMGSQLYSDYDNHRYSYGQQVMAGITGTVHFLAFLTTGSIVPVISGTLLTIYFTAAYYIDRDKVKA